MSKKLLSLLIAMVFCSLAMVLSAQSVVWEETFEADPGTWTMGANWSVTGGALTMNWSPQIENYDVSAVSPNITLPANAGDLVVSQYFDDYSTDTGEFVDIIVIQGGTETVLWTWDTSANDDWGVTGGEDLTLSLAAYAGQTVQLKFRSYGTDSFNINYWYVYNVKIMGSFPHDLAGISIAGNTTPTQGTASPYTVVVRNGGTSAETTYSVKLMSSAGTELVSVPGVAIASGATHEFILNWTPATAGPLTIYGKVVLAGDGAPTNDQTPSMAVTVQGAGTVAITPYNGTATTNNIPVNFYWKNSLTESLWLATEINSGGLLTGIAYYNNFPTDNLMAMPTKVWIGETPLTDLSAGWIPSTELTQVFDGTVDYPVGANTITIPFTTPYPYGGANLVVMVNRPLDTQYYSSGDVFYYTDTPEVPNRTRLLADDTVVLDPTAPQATASISAMNSWAPNATFFLNTVGLGTVTGHVYKTGTNPPVGVEGATVRIQENNRTVLTDATGLYTFNYVIPAAYTLKATKHGYNESTLYPITVGENATVTQDITIQQEAVVTVSGHVVGNDQPTVGLSDCVITMTGYEAYTGTTNANGDFVIPDVYTNHDYTLNVARTGYTSYSQPLSVGTSNVNLPMIVINEVAVPPATVVADTTGGNNQSCLITWTLPGGGGTGTEGWINWDDGVNSDGIGTGGAANFDVAARFAVSDLEEYAGMYLTKVKMFPREAAASYTVKVWTGSSSLTDAGTLAIEQVVTAPVIGEWNEVTLNTAVQIVAGQELWFGYNVDTPSGYPAGCDAGPAILNKGDMMYYEEVWSTLTAITSGQLNYNWSIQGFAANNARSSQAVLLERPASARTGNDTKVVNTNMNRMLESFKVYRLQPGQEADFASWTVVAPNVSMPTLQYNDTAWAGYAPGLYKYAVRAVYTNNNVSTPRISNVVSKNMTVPVTVNVSTNTGDPLTGAMITLTNNDGNAEHVYTMPGTAVTVFPAVWRGTYTMTAVKPGYLAQPQTNISIMVPTTLTLVFTEVANPPIMVQANVSNNVAHVTWTRPGAGGGAGLEQGFEDEMFPPEDWTQVITDNGPGNLGVLATWCRFSEVALTPPVTAYEGTYQAGLWWDAVPQDEWLITNEVGCPTQLNFWTYAYYGSTYNDHYKVNISTNNGSTWTTVWDATEETLGDWNYYATPVSIDLNAYAGQQVKIAWNAHDSDGQGLWYVWFIDDITTGANRVNLADLNHVNTTSPLYAANASFGRNCNARDNKISQGLTPAYEIKAPVLTRNNSHKVSVQTNDRALMSYKIFRLLQGQPEAQWATLATQTDTSDFTYDDTTWPTLPSGVYQYAVKAGYTNNNWSIAALSNPVALGMEVPVTVAVTTNSQDPATGAVVTLTHVDGIHAYTMTYGTGNLVFPLVWKGTYTLSITKTGYSPFSQANISIQAAITLNAQLIEVKSPVVNVTGAVSGTSLTLNWLAPGSGTAQWINWDSGENADGIGTGGANNFDVAARFDTADLEDMNAMYLTKVKFFPREAACEYTVRVWQGGSNNGGFDAGTLVTEQLVPAAVIEDWNEVVLDNPVPIDNTQELWFGYNVNTQAGYPAGCDAGPAIPDKGCMMYFNGAWSNLYDLAPSLDYNWNIHGYVSYGARDEDSMPLSRNNSAKDKDRHLVGYKVKIDGINPPAWEGTALTCTINNLANGQHIAQVYAVYSSGDSQPVTYPFVGNGTNPNKPKVTTLYGNYPNPFNPSTSIKYSVANEQLVNIDIYNVRGQKVKTLVNEVIPSGDHSVVWNGKDDSNKNVSSGIYFFNMKSGKFTSSRKMILMK